MVHGYVVAVGPHNNQNYFTGSGYSAHLNEAKVFRTTRGAMCATHIWQHADYGKPIPLGWFLGRQCVAISLVPTQGELPC